MGTDAKGLGDGPEDKFRLVCITSTFPFSSKTNLVQLVQHVQIVHLFHLVHIYLFRLVYIIFYWLGIGTLLPWNMFITVRRDMSRRANHDQSLIAGGGLLEHKVSYS